MSKSNSWMTSRFLIYAAGNFINTTGNSMYDVAMPLLVYHLTHSSLAMSVTVATEAGAVLFQPLIGTLVDRTSPRTLLTIAMLYQAMLSGTIPLLYGLHDLTLGVIYGLTLLLSLGRNALLSIQTVVVPMMFADFKDRASAGLTASYTVTTILGPLLGGVMLAWTGYQALLWMNCVSFLAPVILLPWTRVPVRKRSMQNTPRTSWWSHTQMGFQELTKHDFTKNLLVSLVALRMVNAAILPLATFLLKHEFGLSNAFVSWIFILQGIGSLIGTQLPMRWHRLSTLHFLLYMAGLNVVGLLCILLPTWPGVPAGLLLGAIGYLGAAVARNLLLQNHIPSELLGRANASFRTVTGMAAIVAPLAMGEVSQAWGAKSAVIVLACVAVVPILLMVRSKDRASVSSAS